MAKIHAYLNFNGNCAEAFNFYESVFNTKSIGTYRFGEMPTDGTHEIPEAAKDKVMHTALLINESTMLMGSDVVEEFGHQYQAGGNSVYIMLDTETAEEAKEIYDKLSVNAQRMEMPLGEQFWAELYACFADQFGINWMIHYEGNKANQTED